MAVIVRLTSTGETVDVSTLDGANAFLEQPAGTDGFNFFSTELKTVNAIRKRERKKGKLNNTDRQTLRDIYLRIGNVAHNGEPELFQEHVPKRELEVCLNHVVEILRQITNDRKWINTGNLLQYDDCLLRSLAGLLRQPTSVVLILDEIKVLETISDMITKLEKQPNAEYANNIIAIVDYTYRNCPYNFEPEWRAEKIFKKLECTGILKHYLRCAAVDASFLANKPSPPFKVLLNCTAYVQKRFKEGTSCGDTVRAIVKGKDGHSPCTRILPYMNSLIQLSTEKLVVDLSDGKVDCTFCCKYFSEENIKSCAKCLRAAYCSRECQRADWKVHKKICGSTRFSKRDKKNAFASHGLVATFIEDSYVLIMIRMVEVCYKAGGLQFDEMVAELDGEPEANGSIPLMKDPPEFQLVPIAKYFDGTRFNDPDSVFVRRSRTASAANNARFLASLTHRHSRRTSTELLCTIFHGGTVSIHAFQNNSEDFGSNHFFSQQALEAFRSAMVDDDFSLLWEMFTTEGARKYILYQLLVSREQNDLPNFSSPEVPC